MSIYDLLIRIVMLKMIIVKKNLNLKKVIKILIITLILILSLTAIIMIIKERYTESKCKWLFKQNRSEKMELRKLDWWENSVVYTVCLQSFNDGDRDGIGDLKGLFRKLGHFVDTGIDVISLSSIFASTVTDLGYEVSSFYDIHYEYGTMDDFDDLISKAHRLGIKVLIDFVPNHASIESQYFKLSENRTQGYENFFVWADPEPGRVNCSNKPSNWSSENGGSIWEWNEIRQQYYLHQFSKMKAVFNFREEAVRKEVTNILKFWLEKGADGFQLSGLPYFEPSANNTGLSLDKVSTNMSASQFEIGHSNRMHLDEILDLVYEWREFVEEWQNKNGATTKLLLAETQTNITDIMLYYGDERNRSGVHLPLNFDLITKLSNKSSARDFVYVINHWLAYMPNGRLANWVLGTHDSSRLASRFSLKMVDGLNALAMMLPGVAFTYQGDEIGMEDVQVSEATTLPPAPRLEKKDTKYTRHLSGPSFRWGALISDEFVSNEESHVSVCQNYEMSNLEAQKTVNRSHYKVYQGLIELRQEPSLSHGKYQIQAISANTLVLVRYLHKFQRYALVFNVGKEDDEVDLRREAMLKEPLVIYMSSVHSERRKGDIIPSINTLKSGEALILRINYDEF